MTVDELDTDFAVRLRGAKRARRSGFTWARREVELLEALWGAVLASQGRGWSDLGGRARSVVEDTRQEQKDAG